MPRHTGAPNASPYARHVPALDGIRGLAVLGVVASHVFPATPNSIITRLASHLLIFGATGVDLFFALSGLLITGILYDSLADKAYFRKFYARRTLRIFPLYYGVIAAFAISALIFGLHYHHELLSLAFYLQNTWFIAVPVSIYLGNPQLPLSHFWSLAIEEQFYLVWPLLVFLIRDRKRLVQLCLASFLLCPLLRLALSLHGATYAAINTNIFCRVDSLFAGAALALLLRSRMHDHARRAGPWLLLAGLAISVHFATQSHGSESTPGFLPSLELALRYTGLAAASAGLIVMSLNNQTARRFFTLAPMRMLGKYSYGIYVFHLILFTFLQTPLRVFIAAHLSQSKLFGVLATGITICAITLITVGLSYHLYENRFLRLKHLFDYKPAAKLDHPPTEHFWDSGVASAPLTRTAQIEL